MTTVVKDRWIYLFWSDVEPLTSDAIMKTEGNTEYVAVEYELPEYPIQMTEERQKQERRVSQ